MGEVFRHMDFETMIKPMIEVDWKREVVLGEGESDIVTTSYSGGDDMSGTSSVTVKTGPTLLGPSNLTNVTTTMISNINPSSSSSSFQSLNQTETGAAAALRRHLLQSPLISSEPLPTLHQYLKSPFEFTNLIQRIKKSAGVLWTNLELAQAS